MPIYRKTPKRGFNSIKKLRSNSLSVSLISFNKFNDDSQIDMKLLVESGFLKKKDQKKSIKIIDSIQFKKKLQFKDFKFTPGAKKRIEDLGGSAS
jgi:ribosomal protein L15